MEPSPRAQTLGKQNKVEHLVRTLAPSAEDDAPKAHVSADSICVLGAQCLAALRITTPKAAHDAHATDLAALRQTHDRHATLPERIEYLEGLCLDVSGEVALSRNPTRDGTTTADDMSAHDTMEVRPES